MVRSVRDDANILGYGNVFPIADIGELSARLKPGTAYHRIGNFFYYNDFEFGLGPMIFDVAAGNNYGELVNGEAFSGSVSAHLVSDVSLSDFAGLMVYLPPLEWTSFGISFLFKCPTHIGILLFYIRIVRYPRVMYAAIRYEDINRRWIAINTDYQEVTIATGLEVMKSPFVWHHLYFSFDAQKNTFKKLIFDENTIDISSVTISQKTVMEKSHILTSIYAFGDGSTATDMYVDTVAFMQNVEH